MKSQKEKKNGGREEGSARSENLSGLLGSGVFQVIGYYGLYRVGLLLPCKKGFCVTLLNCPKDGLAVCWEQLSNRGV